MIEPCSDHRHHASFGKYYDLIAFVANIDCMIFLFVFYRLLDSAVQRLKFIVFAHIFIAIIFSHSTFAFFSIPFYSRDVRSAFLLLLAQDTSI